MEWCLNTCTIGAVPRGALELEDQLSAASDSGFNLVGLDINTIRIYRERGSLISLRARMDDLGLRCHEVHTLRCGVAPDGSETHAADLIEFAEVAAALDATWVNNSIHTPCSTAMIDHLVGCAQMLSDIGTGLSLEFQVEFGGGSFADALALYNNIKDAGRTGIQLDPWHFFRGPNELSELSVLTAGDISFVQFNDGEPDAGRSGPRKLPGHGSFDLEGYVSTIRQSGFDGVVEIEYFVPSLMTGDPVASAVEQLDAARPYWKGTS